MDCHLPGTDFELLGFFKEPNYREWMEQLFKHLGVCIWTDEEYEFMQQDREIWPGYCTELEGDDDNGQALYYDIKPLPSGRMTVGVYTDPYCIEEYKEETAFDIIEGAYDNGDDDDATLADLEEYIDTWNDAFDIFKICQPCRAYDLGWNEDLQNGDEPRQGEVDENGNVFTCRDDAGYTNVNQCMKFKTKTEMKVATVQDILLAADQGTIMEIDINGRIYGDNDFLAVHYAVHTGDKVFFFVSLGVLLIGAAMFGRAWFQRGSSMMKEPLIESEGVIA